MDGKRNVMDEDEDVMVQYRERVVRDDVVCC